MDKFHYPRPEANTNQVEKHSISGPPLWNSSQSGYVSSRASFTKRSLLMPPVNEIKWFVGGLRVIQASAGAIGQALLPSIRQESNRRSKFNPPKGVRSTKYLNNLKQRRQRWKRNQQNN